MFDLSGKVALVTGAMRGMCKAHALALASQGAAVVVTDVDEGICALVVREIEVASGKAICVKMDVTKKDEVEAAFDAAVKEYGRLDILVNNAGIYFAKPALELTEEEWDRTIDINLKGQFLCAQRAAREMARNTWGRIINIASIASGQSGIGIPASAHYTASKGGIIGMTESLAAEWALLGVTVNAIAPGAIDTPMMAKEEMSREEMDSLLARIPMRRAGTSEEVAAMVVFLASQESSYVTGATFTVDGGWMAN